MSHIKSILRAAQCRSTHHYFAVDALDLIRTPNGHRLATVLLKYHDEYLIGAKAPDKSFKDFRNHVLHVGDNNWGGAPALCEKWYSTAVEHLDRNEWKQAAYACGVLSHYFTDPLMPLHTGQSDKEGVVHRPLEWSVCKSYDAIMDLVSEQQVTPDFELTQASDWLSSAVLSGASFAHQFYDRLIDEYDLNAGCRRPTEGLNEDSRAILAQLFSMATNGWARILERLADETQTRIPEMSLGLASLLASLDMPVAWIVRKISDVGEQRAVKRLFAEYQATGKITKHLPAEVASVAAERRRDLEAQEPSPRVKVIPPAAKPYTPRVGRTASSKDNLQADISASVSRASKLVDAPSIGPKTASRFQKIFIHTIGEFLDADPDKMCLDLDARWITAPLLREWQCQASLVCGVPALCGYKSQLLVGVGCRSVDALVQSNAAKLSQQIRAFTHTPDGQRILRSSRVPAADDVQEWIDSAREFSARRAA